MSYKLKHTAEAIDDKLSLINKNKNLLPYPYEEEPGGVGLIDVGDGSFLTNTDFPEAGYEFLLHTVVLPGGRKYKISLDIADFIDEYAMTVNPGFSLIVRNKSGADLDLNNEVLDLSAETEETSISVFLYVPAGARANLIVKPQIEEGEEQTAWVPYMKDIANYVDERFNSTNVKIKAIAEAVANNAGSSEYTGPENIEDGTTTGIQQIQDQESGVTAGYFNFTNKNQQATKHDNSLTGEIEYGATGEFAVAFGGKSAAIGKRSMAVGTTTIAKGKYSFACGDNSVTLGNDSFAANYQTTAKGQASAAFGSGTISEGSASVAMGKETHAKGEYSFATGYQSKSNSQSSAAIGAGAVTSSEINGQVVVGRYNRYDTPASSQSVFIVGSGGSDTARETAMSIDIYGDMWKGSNPSALDRYITAGEAFRLPESVSDKADGTYIPCYGVTSGKMTSGKESPNSLQLATSWAKGNTLVGRDENGAINIGTPTAPGHAATKQYVDNSHIAKIKETLTQLFDRDEFYEVQSTGTITVRLTCNSQESFGSDTWLDCNHDLEVFFDGDANKTTLPLPKGTLISITGKSETGDAHYLLNNSTVTVYLEDSDYSGDGGPGHLIGFDAFTPNSSETINKTYRDATSDHVLYADTGESSMVWDSTCFETTEESQEVTLTYTLAKNKYLEALETL